MLVPMNTPIRCAAPATRRLLDRLDESRLAAGQVRPIDYCGNRSVADRRAVVASSTPATSPICVSRSTVSNSQGLSPLRCSSKECECLLEAPPDATGRREFLEQKRFHRYVCGSLRSAHGSAARSVIGCSCRALNVSSSRGSTSRITGSSAAAARRVAVMQQQNVPALQELSQAPIDGVRIAVDGIEAAVRPAREAQLQAAQHGFEKGITQPGGCAKETRAAAGHARNALLCLGDLGADGAGTEQREGVPVALTVVFNRMPAADDFLRELRIALDAFSHAKEARARAVRAKLRQDRAASPPDRGHHRW